MVASFGEPAIASIRVPWLGLQPAETYEQMIGSLLALDTAVETVFDRVEHRIAQEQATLRAIERRIDSAGERARRVAGNMNTATVVFSAARYPAEEKPEPFRRLFYDDGVEAARAAETVARPAESPPAESAMCLAHRRDAVRLGGLTEDEVLADFELSLSLRPELAVNHTAAEGQGGWTRPLPGSVQSASSTVLFNTSLNAYSQHGARPGLSGRAVCACWEGGGLLLWGSAASCGEVWRRRCGAGCGAERRAAAQPGSPRRSHADTARTRRSNPPLNRPPLNRPPLNRPPLNRPQAPSTT